MKTYLIPPLVSGGLMLSYRCTNRCVHCLYRCSPKKPNTWITKNRAAEALAALAREPELESIHLSGGEATLRMDLLVEIIAMAREAGVPLSYLETNAITCTSPEKGEEIYGRLRAAGLPMILISTSMFHNEFVPFERMKMAVEAAGKVFGERNVIVWVPHLYDILGRMDGIDRTRTLEEFCLITGLDQRKEMLPGLYHLVPGGRVTEEMRDSFTPDRAAAYRTSRCSGEITSTTHFHIDPMGHLFTGLCAGIISGTVDDLHPVITGETRSLLHLLCTGGPVALMELAMEKYGFEEDPGGYVSKCDLCLQVRQFLRTRDTFPEFGPDDYYED